MSSTREIKRHIDSVKETQKITNAMYLISSMKMRKAKQELDAARPYFEEVKSGIKRLFRLDSNLKSPYFYPPEGEKPLNGTYGMLVVTADKGLAGGYNTQILKQMEQILAMHPDTKLFMIGEYGRRYCQSHRIPVEENFLYTAQNPTMNRAREISSSLLSRFNAGEIEKLYILYTDLKNGMQTEPVYARILPFHRASFKTDTVEKEIKQPFEFSPSMEVVLNLLVPSYVSGYIYSALVDSFCSEQEARMSAMKSAGDNASDLLADLTQEFNHVRQNNVTQEITEISTGRQALNKF